ncbi:MAG: NifU family protein [Alphaproteobacteria bacterium]|nr:NifU family protein [Alphaproteobacteria bacterium]
MFIQTEDTPNPATMKFLPSRAVVETPLDLANAAQACVSPLAQALFNVDGVAGVFLGLDFISVTRTDDVEWPVLRPAILATIMDHFVAGRPVLREGQADVAAAPVTSSAEDVDVVRQINELLDLRIRPAVAQDGGDVAFERYEDGIVYLRLKGACAGCPSATATLKFGIEQMLRHFIPEVQEVRRVE